MEQIKRLIEAGERLANQDADFQEHCDAVDKAVLALAAALPELRGLVERKPKLQPGDVFETISGGIWLVEERHEPRETLDTVRIGGEAEDDTRLGHRCEYMGDWSAYRILATNQPIDLKTWPREGE